MTRSSASLSPRANRVFDNRGMATTLTFPEWLAEQQDRGDHIAEFAKEVAHLTDFPSSGGKAIYDGYFETALPEQQKVYGRAWEEFAAHPEPAAS
jgi:hypothetical protein